MTNNKIVWLDCNCHSAHHAIRVWHESDETWNELSIEMRVNNWRGFFRRCIEAFKYVFNFKNHNCGYDSFNIHEKDVDSFMDILVSYRDECKRREKEVNELLR